MLANPILIVEDGETSRRLLAALLERNGFPVLCAKNAEEGLSMIMERHPHLVILDVLLPDMDGFDLCARIKAEPQTSGIPIIFITQLDDLANKLRGLAVGGVDYITKPYVADEVLARIRAQLELKKKSERLIAAQRRRLEELHDVQDSFLTDLGPMPEARCGVYFEASEEAGGDQYDVIPISVPSYAYCVSDISGHGIEAALLSNIFKAFFRENAASLGSPDATFLRLNSLMADYLSEGQHITATCLVLDRATRVATLVSAGHLPVLMTSPSGEVRELRAEGDVLGPFIAPVFQPLSLRVEKGSRFWLFTDGIVEDFRERRSWKAGLEVLKRLLPRYAALPIEEAVRAAAAELFARHPGEDDRLLLACEA